jgi:hypothetical protein
LSLLKIDLNRFQKIPTDVPAIATTAITACTIMLPVPGSRYAHAGVVYTREIQNDIPDILKIRYIFIYALLLDNIKIKTVRSPLFSMSKDLNAGDQTPFPVGVPPAIL